MNETPLHEPLIAEEGKEKERVFTGTPERIVNILPCVHIRAYNLLDRLRQRRRDVEARPLHHDRLLHDAGYLPL